jgi:hypothetical protein
VESVAIHYMAHHTAGILPGQAGGGGIGERCRAQAKTEEDQRESDHGRGM